jgi:hypothetical protein
MVFTDDGRGIEVRRRKLISACKSAPRPSFQRTAGEADIVGRFDIGVVAVHLDERIVSLVVFWLGIVRSVDVDAPKLLVRVTARLCFLIANDHGYGDHFVFAQSVGKEPSPVCSDCLHETLCAAVGRDVGDSYRRATTVAGERRILREQ